MRLRSDKEPTRKQAGLRSNNRNSEAAAVGKSSQRYANTTGMDKPGWKLDSHSLFFPLLTVLILFFYFLLLVSSRHGDLRGHRDGVPPRSAHRLDRCPSSLL
jgi:hypothetical protein